MQPSTQDDEADYLLDVRHAELLRQRQALERKIEHNERKAHRLTAKALERWLEGADKG